MDFLSLALQCSFLPIVIGPPIEIELGAPGYIVQTGSGDPCRSGDKVTLDFLIQDENGKEIANSFRRGIDHTFELFGSPGDALLTGAALGAQTGEERWVVLIAEKWYEGFTPFSLIRNPGPVLVRVKVSKIERR
jgi:hypothetical protein